MRARQRHFNARDAGARIALDARFLSGLNNGDAVSTWTNRIGSSDFTGSGTARPTYTASSFSGNPALTFDGTNDTMAATGITWSADFTNVYVVRFNRSPNYTGLIDTIACKTNYIQAQPKGFYAMMSNHFVSTTNTYFTTEYAQVGTGKTSTVINGVSSTAAAGNGTVGAATILSANATGSNTDANTSFTLGNEPSTAGRFGKMDFAYFAYLPQSSSTLRRRLEQSAAYSFKIACS